MPKISTSDLRPIIAKASRAAGQICRQSRSHLIEPEDVRQDLLLDLVARLKSFDPARSSLRTFAAICFQHRSKRLAQVLRGERQARHPIALDAPVHPYSELTLADTIAEADGYAGWIGQPVDGVARLEQFLDIDRVLTAMAADAVPLCVTLLLERVDPAAAAGMSRTTFYRRIRELRCQMLAAGLLPQGGTSCSEAG